MASRSASVAIAAVGIPDVMRRPRTTVAASHALSHDRATVVLSPWHVRVPSAHIQRPVCPVAHRMTQVPAATLKRTPLHDIHVALGGKIVPFAGYEMPVQYAQGITVEHKAVRERAGLFDVSHMGEFIITGDRAVDFVTYVTTNDVAALAIGQVHYSTILNDLGTI